MKKSIETGALLGVVCFALTPIAPAYAANWVYVDADADNTVVYYDADTIQRSGDQVLVWVRYDHSRDKTEKARETKVRAIYDCAARTFISRAAITYFPNGNVDTFEVPSYQQRSFSVVPGSIAEALLEAVCR